jgi:phosphoribosylanthranilate isomerase
VPVDAKICGITRPADAAHAVAHGAARIGVVFAWGPRVVTVDGARAIVEAAGEVPVIGVVSGSSPTSHLLSLAQATGLRGLQLHGASSAATARALSASGLEVWRVATIGSRDTLDEVLMQGREGASVVLLEPLVTGPGGGRGIALDLTLAREATAVLAGHRVGLAGGLTPGTVASAIEFVGPDIVDVSSGVEDAPGIKSPERVARFLEAVRDAGATPRPDS